MRRAFWPVEISCCKYWDFSIVSCLVIMPARKDLVLPVSAFRLLGMQCGLLIWHHNGVFRLSAASEARGERSKINMVLRLAFVVFFSACLFCGACLLLGGNWIAGGILGDARCARAFPFMMLCLALTGIENIFKSLFIGLERMQYAATSEVCEQLIRIATVWFLLYQYEGDDYGTIAMLIFVGIGSQRGIQRCFFEFALSKLEDHRVFIMCGWIMKLCVNFSLLHFPVSASALFGQLQSVQQDRFCYRNG